MKPPKIITGKINLLLFSLLLVAGDGSQARQFRQIIPIATLESPSAQLPDGAIQVDQVTPLERGEVEPLLRKVLEEWNASGMAGTLAEEFYDSSRLIDAMDTIVPRDAKLRLQSIQGIQTVQQYILPEQEDGRDKMISIVSATARTQVEFERPGAGFVRLPGINEFILKVTHIEAE
jgi:hypothetical protein